MSDETLKRPRDPPPHHEPALSELGFDFAPPEIDEPVMSKKQRKAANFNPRGRAPAGTVEPRVASWNTYVAPKEGEAAVAASAPPTAATRAAELEEENRSSSPELEPVSNAGKNEPIEDAEVDVPALSHKALRLLKRRKLSGVEDAPPVVVTPSGNKIPGVPGVIVGNTPGKSAFGIWLGNMNYSTTNKMLLAWLDEHGLKEIVRINMPMGRRSGEMNRG